MKEMRLFEVGFKEEYEKFYVGATSAMSAAELARKHLMQKVNAWWADGGMEFMVFEEYAEDNKAPEDLPDKEVLAIKKYQNKAARLMKAELERTKNLYLARVHDVGGLVI